MSVRSNSPIHHDTTKSQFSIRDLRLLGQSSVLSPLRVVTLIDFDCFYAQCETVRLGLSPEHPLGVQQFKHVIAMNYAARARGLKKVQSVEEAKRLCPELVLQHVPTWREGDTTWRYREDSLEHMDIEKSSLDFYRLKSRQAMQVLKEVLAPSVQKIERAGIDETYVDLSVQVHAILLDRFPELVIEDDFPGDFLLPLPRTTPPGWGNTVVEPSSRHDDSDRSTFVSPRDEYDDGVESLVDWDDIALQIGCEIVNDVRQRVLDELHYTCSAGIARNKVVAKLAAGHNKPNKQTVVSNAAVSSFLRPYKFTSMRGLGGKLGLEMVQKLGRELISELLPIPLDEMKSNLRFQTAFWLYNIIRGNEHSEVVSRTQVKSILSAKTFMTSITSMEQAEKWLYIFAADIVGRLEDLGPRRPKTIATHVQVHGPRSPTRSKQAPIPAVVDFDVQCLLKLSRRLLLELSHEGATWPCVTLSVSISDLQDIDTKNRSLKLMLADQEKSQAQKSPVTADKVFPVTALEKEPPRKRTLLDFHGFHPDVQRGGDAGATKRVKPEPAASDKTGVMNKYYEGDATRAGTYACPTCHQPVLEADVLEHLDWHAALDLQNNIPS